MHPTAIATLVGFFGDAILQFMVRMGMGGSTGWGLKPYFKQHGSTEALFTAAGMMALFFVLYVATGLPLKLQYLAVYGILLDLLFREANLFPSLKGYYQSLNYFWSAVWGAIPMMIPLLIMKAMNKDLKIV
jgi:hypothetical protein